MDEETNSVTQRVVGLGRRGARRIRRRLVVPKKRRTELVAAHKKLLRMGGDRLVSHFAPSVLELGSRIQQDDKPVLVGPWVSELGFEILYWIPFVKWFVERFGITPERLVFVSRGGMEAWYRSSAWHGEPRYVDAFALLSTEAYRAGNEKRWLRAGGQKQGDPDPFEDDILHRAVERLGIGQHHILHPRVMYDFLKIFWTHTKRHLSVGPTLVMKHARFEPLADLEPWSGAPLPGRFVAVKFYERPSLPRTPETKTLVERLLLQIAEQCPVISLDTAFRADDHSAFPLPDHPDIVSARDWMTPETNLGDQTRLAAAADFFIGTYGGTAYMPAFVGTPAFGLYSEKIHINFAHQALVMQAGLELGHGVTILPLTDCARFSGIVAGTATRQVKTCISS